MALGYDIEEALYGWVTTRDGAMVVSEPEGSMTWYPVSDHPTDKATYSFAIPSFSAAGGDGYPKINTINAGLVDAGVLKEYIEVKKTILVADYQPAGEVSYVNSASLDGCK
jgi:hypothetical protein